MLTENATFTSETTATTNIKEMMIECRNEQLVQVRERKLSSANIVIYGVMGHMEQAKEKDEEFVKDDGQ